MKQQERAALLAELAAYEDLVIACVGESAPDVQLLRRAIAALEESGRDTERIDWLNLRGELLPPHQGAPWTRAWTLAAQSHHDVRSAIDAERGAA